MAALLQLILIGLIAVIVFFTIALMGVTNLDAQEKSEILTGNLLGFLVVAIPFVLLRRGYFRLSTLILILILIITPALTITVLFDLSRSNGILVQCTLAMILSSLLVSRWALIFVFGVSTALVTFSVFLWQGAEPHLVTANVQTAINFVLYNGLIALFLDQSGIALRAALTDALTHQSELHSEIIEHRRAEKQVLQMKRLYATLSQVNQTIVRVRDRNELYQSICDMAVQFGGFSLAAVELLDESTGEITPVAAGGLDLANWPFEKVNIYQGAFADGLIATAIRTASVVTSEDLQTDQSTRKSSSQFEQDMFHSSAAIPFQLHGTTIGVVSLISSERGLFKAEEEVSLLREMGLDISFALERLETEKLRRQWANAFVHCAHGIAIGLPTGHILTCNPAFAQQQGRTVEEISSMPILAMYEPSEHAYIRQCIAEADRTGHVQYDARMLRKNGDVYSVQMNVVSVRDESGNLQYRVATQQNITERKQAEQALQTNEQRYRELVQNANSAIIRWRSDGTITFFNEYAQSFFGYRAEEILGKHVGIIVPQTESTGGDLSGLVEEIVAHPEHFINNVNENICKDGRRVWMIWSNRPFYNENGQLEGILAVGSDITERKYMEEELRRSNADLEQFAYVASHDLQEPLRSLASMVQLLQKRYQGHLDARADEYISHAVEASSRMQALIRDLLAYSRLDRRSQPIKPVSAQDCLHMALKNLSASIHESGAVIVAENLPIVHADPTQLTQLFQNLIGNGIKFRGEQEPHIQVTATRLNDAWQFAVSDNGIGIEGQYFERIFLIFQRLHTRRHYQGTGIGLALCKKIIERHGGSIRVESRPGEGSTFYFTLPIRSTL